jgi:1-aminocyclopropane-1-carboxylate deaminase
MLDFESIIQIPTPLLELRDKKWEDLGLRVLVKRDDLTHPMLSGNKYRKLKYNLNYANEQGFNKLLTFGGAYSNHLYAFAFACKYFGFEGTAIIRGEELKANSSPTLAYAFEKGVDLRFVSRTAYREKEQFYEDNFYIIPEGGSNALALDGVEEIWSEIPEKVDYILTACGTGGTLAGLLKGAPSDTEVIGVPVLKGGEFIREEVGKWLKKPFTLFTQYHFGGYARHTPELLHFIQDFQTKYSIPLEQVYTGKMFFAFNDLAEKGYFKRGSTVVLLHTGGLQGRIPILAS